MSLAMSLANASLTSSTVDNYNRHLKRIFNFVTKILNMDWKLPLSSNMIAMFVAFQHRQGYSFSYIAGSLSALSFLNSIHSLPDYTKSDFIGRLLKGVKNSSQSEHRLLPITSKLLEDILVVLQSKLNDDFDKCMYSAVFSLMYFACLRVGEIAISGNNDGHTLKINNVFKVVDSKGVHSYILVLDSYKFSKGKTARLLISQFRQVSICPVHTLRSYLNIRPGLNGCLFIRKNGLPLQRHNIAIVLKQCINELNLCDNSYNTHAFRIGRATDLAVQGVSQEKIRIIGRWSSDAYQKYVRPIVVTCMT